MGHAGGWVNTSVSCLVTLPLLCFSYSSTCLSSILRVYYDNYSTAIVLTGQAWSWSVIIVFRLADTQTGGGGPMANGVHRI